LQEGIKKHTESKIKEVKEGYERNVEIIRSKGMSEKEWCKTQDWMGAPSNTYDVVIE
jgi:hypothetical protein